MIDAATPLDGMTDPHGGHPMFRALDERDRALVRAILSAALKHRKAIQAMVSARLDRPLPPNASHLGHVLHVAMAQIMFLDVPDSAAVDMAVEQAKADPRTRRFAALVNGLLRSAAREKSSLPATLAATTEGPDWFVRRLDGVYGRAHAAAILAAHGVEAPVDFTVKSDPRGWAERLGGIVLPTGSVRVASPDRAIIDLPGYAEGEWWIQDAAAALPAQLFGDLGGRRVADLCAAPGGKTAQLCLAGAHVTAVEASANRMARLGGNLARLGLEANLVNADLFAYAPNQRFDAILLDAPCSSTGTVRRHPDVAWTKTPDDIDRLAHLQRRMVEAAAGMLRPGGTLVFSNCSLDPTEGEDMIRQVLAQSSTLRLDPIGRDEIPGCPDFVTEDGFLRTTPAGLPGLDPRLSGLDGFFAARLVRTA